ncbi:MAG: SDR family oxidoreductase [Acidimicrobiales bacterium]|nr:SDR family oxidoreductase [Acidimicrobiales bacterium]
MFDLTGKTALVTGAGQNVGAGIARVLAGQGARVLVNDLTEAQAADTVDAIVGAGGQAEALPFDVTDLAAVGASIGTVANTAAGPIDILVNNAGNSGATGMVPTRFQDMDPADWDAPIEVNLRGVMHCIHAALPGMLEQGWGRLITISSGAGTVGVNIGVTPYSAGKGGAVAFMRSLALELASTGITANSVALGLMNNVGSSDVTAKLAQTIPTKRLGTPEDVGHLCAYLASEESSWMTAQTIGLSGGSTTS